MHSTKPERSSSSVGTKNVAAFLRFLRFPMTLAPVGGYVAGWMVTRASLVPTALDIRGTLAMLALAVGALAFNGYEDRQIDAGKDTRFALENPGTALMTAGLGYAATLLLAASLGRNALAGFALLCAFSLLYSRVFVYLPGVKNLAAAAMSADFVWLGGIVSFGANSNLRAAATAAFFGLLAMVLVEDIEDESVDRGHRITLPMVIPARGVKFLVLGSVLTAVLTASYFRAPSIIFWIPFLLAAGAFVISALLLPSRRPAPPPTASRWLVWNGLWVGLVAMVAGSILR